jgi:hypothetical protein
MGDDEGFFSQGRSREARFKKIKTEEEEFEPGSFSERLTA